MYRVEEDKDVLKICFSSEMEKVDRAVSDVLKFFPTVTSRGSFELETLLRELLINAIEHGNKKDSSRSVTFEIHNIGNMRVKVKIQDEGEGFDFENLTLAIQESTSEVRSRGIAMINRLADELIYIKPGNRAEVWYTFPKVTEYAIENDDGLLRVSPDGDISAASVENLRKLLMENWDDNHRGLEWNLNSVVSIDSMGLSVLLSFAHKKRKEIPDYSLAIRGVSSELFFLLEFVNADSLYEISKKEGGKA